MQTIAATPDARPAVASATLPHTARHGDVYASTFDGELLIAVAGHRPGIIGGLTPYDGLDLIRATAAALGVTVHIEHPDRVAS